MVTLDLPSFLQCCDLIYCFCCHVLTLDLPCSNSWSMVVVLCIYIYVYTLRAMTHNYVAARQIKSHHLAAQGSPCRADSKLGLNNQPGGSRNTTVTKLYHMSLFQLTRLVALHLLKLGLSSYACRKNQSQQTKDLEADREPDQ